jgi:hypothetical protein
MQHAAQRAGRLKKRACLLWRPMAATLLALAPSGDAAAKQRREGRTLVGTSQSTARLCPSLPPCLSPPPFQLCPPCMSSASADDEGDAASGADEAGSGGWETDETAGAAGAAGPAAEQADEDEEVYEEDEDIRPRALPVDGEPDFESVRRQHQRCVASRRVALPRLRVSCRASPACLPARLACAAL